MTYFKEFSRYIITRGVILSAFMLAAVAILLARAWKQPADAWLLRQYADHLQAMSAVVLGVALLGGLALEEVLRR